MKAHTILSRIAIVLLALLMLALSGTLAWAAVTDYQARGLVPNGVSVVGTSLAGLTEDQARSAIQEAVSTPMMRPVTVTGDHKTFVVDPKGIVVIDVDGMLAEAYAPRRTATFIDRLQHDIARKPLPADVKPKYTVDQSAVATWVVATARTINRKPTDAKRIIKDYKLIVKPCIYGARVNDAAAVQLISTALTAESALATATRVVALPITLAKPHIVEASFKKTLVVSLSQHKVRLYKGAKIEKTYPIAIGTSAHPTPPGDWKIINKRYMPTWTNPGSAWAVGMPASIAPGPGNPLGTRALDLSASGIRFHGTSNIGSVGTAASHGCMRMYMHDIEELYPLVPVNTPVYIRS